MSNSNGTNGYKYDLVGTHEAALILGVEKPRIGRYEKQGRMPRPVCKLAATKLWHRADIQAMARGERPRAARPIKLVGTREASEMLGVERTRIGRWKSKGIMPQPVSVTKATPVWLEQDIRRLAKQVAKDRADRAKSRAAIAA